MRSRSGGVAGNPVLIGAATTLVIVVAMFLSYNANKGLPFVPTYSLRAEVPSAANLVVGNEVRTGGARVGAIDKITAERKEDGTNVAILGLRLEKSVEPLPKDSTLLIRPKSVLGLKYVELTRGTSSEGFGDGDRIPVTAATPEPVEFDEVANIFDKPTRDAIQTNLQGFGDAFAGRGSSINLAIGSLRPLLRDAVPVLQNLSDPDTNLRRFFQSLADTAAEVAPVAEEQAELIRNLDTTFGALRDVARPFIQESIEEGPATLQTAIDELPGQRAFLVNSEGLFRELRPGVRALRTAAPDLSAALRVGTPTLRRSVQLNRRLTPVFRSLQAFATDTLVPRGVRRLRDGLTALAPTLKFLEPTQTRCNYVYLWFRNVASLLSEGDANGTWQRFNIVALPQGTNSEGGPSSGPASGPTQENYLHTNYYPNTGADGQTVECEAANEEYLVGRQVIGNVPGTQKASTEGTP
jgi:virulence factor Mce-like protein